VTLTLRTLALLWALLAGGCLVDPMDQEYVALSVVLDTPPAALTGGGSYSPWDSQGLFRLGQSAKDNQFPKLVRVTVGASGKKTVAGTWPDPKKGVGAGEGASGEVVLSLTVPSGPSYSVGAVAWLVTAAGLRTYRQQKVQTVDLVAGKQTDLTLDMVSHETGTMEGTVRCKSGNTGAWQPYAISVVDAEALAIYPRSLVTLDRTLFSYTLTLKDIPAGRASWFRITLRNASNQERNVDVRSPTYAVKKAGDKVLLNLQIPCMF